MTMTDSGSGGSSNNTASVLSSIVSSYKDRPESSSNPSLVQSMLRNTTETGDIGTFSIAQGNLAFSSSPSSLNRASSQASFLGPGPRRPREHTHSRYYGHGDRIGPHPSLRGLQAEEVHSACRAGTPCSQYARASSMKNGSQLTFSDLSCPSQANPESLSRPRSPFAYPTRLKRPGYRSSSPSLMDFNGTDARTYVGLDKGHVSHPPAILRHPPGRPGQRRPCIPSHLHPGLGSADSQPPRFPMLPSYYNQQHEQEHHRLSRAPSAQSTRSQESFVTSMTTTTNHPQVSSARGPPSMTYYDYSENFGGYTNHQTSKADAYHNPRFLRHIPSRSIGNKRKQTERDGVPLQRAQTSLIVHVDQSLDGKRLGPEKAGKLAEWEQLGISSRLLNKKKSSDQQLEIKSKAQASVEPVILDLHVQSPRLPMPIMDGCDSSDAIVDEDEVQNPSATKDDLEHKGYLESQTNESKDGAQDGKECSESHTVGPASQKLRNKSNALPQHADKAAVGKQLLVDETKRFPSPEAFKVAALADVPIQSPRPERPLSFRNPNDRLSRILSIDESFSDENDAANLTKKHPINAGPSQPTDLASKGIQKIAHNLSDKKSIRSDEPKAMNASAHGQFQRLRSHFNKNSSPHENDVRAKDNKNGTGQAFSQENAAQSESNLEEPFVSDRTDRAEKLTKHVVIPLKQRSTHPLSDGAIDPERLSCEVENSTAGSHIEIYNDQHQTEQLLDEDKPPPPLKSSKRCLRNPASYDDLGLPRPETPAQHLSDELISQGSPLEAQKHRLSHVRPSLIDTAPRIFLHPPTPSLGLDDVGSIFSDPELRTTLNDSSEIVDAVVVGTEPSTASKEQNRNSRRWTKVSSLFMSNQGRLEGEETRGMSWFQYTRWKIHERMKECRRSGSKCLGRRKEGNSEGSVEMSTVSL